MSDSFCSPDGSFALNGGTGGGSGYDFPNAFLDHSGLLLPESTWKILRWSEYIFSANPTYRQAMERVLAYFITDIEIGGDDIGDDERDKYKDYLYRKFHIDSVLKAVGLDYLCYNNAFVSCLLKFRRHLACPKQGCGAQYPFRSVAENPAFNFRWNNFAFYARCPRCGFQGDFGKPIDRRGTEDDVYLKRWNPHEIEIVWDPYTEDRSYLWKIPADYRQLVTEGRPYILERANWEIIQAIKDNKHFRLADDALYHLHDPALAGLYARGWGIPKAMTNFRYVYMAQLLFKFNEAIAMDYIIPFRVITPAPVQGADPAARDPILNMNMQSFVGRIQGMLRRRRRDPATWNVLPFPIQYQALGGDASKLAPKELLDQAQEMLLNAIGVPVELYKGTLQLQSAPTALRLFQSQWTWLVDSLDGMLAHIAKRLSVLLAWKDTRLTLTPVTHADDAEARSLKLQLAAGGDVSKTTALAGIDVNYREEVRKKLQEQVFEAAEQEKMQDVLQNAAGAQQLGQPQPPGGPGGAGAPPGPGGAPPAGGPPGQAGGQPQDPVQQVLANLPMNPNQPITPQDMLGKAQTIAGQLAPMPDAQRRQALTQIRQVDPTLHQLVRGQLEQIRSQARSQGQQMVMAQQAQQPGP